MITKFRFKKIQLTITFLLFALFSTVVLTGYAAPSTSPDSYFPLFIIVDETPGVPGMDSTFIFADHDSTLSSGNWIKLTGGTEHTIPSTSFTLSYPPDSNVSVGGSQIAIDRFLASDTFTYPISTHTVYLEGESIIANFYGSTAFAGDEDLAWRLIPANQSELETAFANIMNGDPSDLKTMLSSSNSVWEELVDSLGGLGDTSTTFTAPSAGTYGLFLVAETSNPYSLTIYSFTVVEVTVDYSITTSVPSTVTQNTNLFLTITLNAPPVSTDGFNYGGVIIKDSVYDFDVEISSDASVNGTSVSINGEPIVEGSGNLGSATLFFPGFASVSELNSTAISQKLSNIIPAGNIALGFSSKTTETQQTISISTSGLNTGTYHVFMGVWENNTLAGFISDTIEVTTPSSPPPPSGGGGGGGGGGGILVPPSAAVINLIDPEDAYDLLEPFSAKQIAGVLEDVNPEHILDILEFFDPEDKYEILNQLSLEKLIELFGLLNAEEISEIMSNLTIDKTIIIKGLNNETAGQVLNQLDPEESASIILELIPENFEIIESMIINDTQRAALNIEAAVKMILDETDPEIRDIMLGELVDTLENLSLDSLVNLLIEIANLPDTPSTVATIMEKMEPTTLNLVIEKWDSLGSYNSLANVMNYTSLPLLENIYRALSNLGRLNIYQYLTESTIANLPEISTITVSSLTVTPEIEEGGSVEIAYEVKNTGEVADDYIIETFIGVNSVDISSGILDAGETKEISFTIEMTTAGTYQVFTEDLSETFEVITPEVIAPANFIIDSIESIPTSLTMGDALSIIVTISNDGDVSGTTTIDLLLDEDIIDSKEVEILAHETQSVIFEIDLELDSGVHVFSVEGISTDVTVTESSRQLPIASIAIVTLIIIAGVGYYLKTKNIIELPF